MFFFPSFTGKPLNILKFIEFIPFGMNMFTVFRVRFTLLCYFVSFFLILILLTILQFDVIGMECLFGTKFGIIFE